MKRCAGPKDAALAMLAESMSEWNTTRDEVACVSMTREDKMTFCFLSGERMVAVEEMRKLIGDAVNDESRPEPFGLLLLTWQSESFVEARTKSFCTEQCRAEGCDAEALLKTLDGRYFNGTLGGERAWLPWIAEGDVQ